MKEILIIEEERVIREGLRRILTDAGYAVRMARDGEAGILEWRKRRPSLIIMDGMMPRMNGLRATAIIRSEDVSIPIILESAWCADQERVEMLKRSNQGSFAGFIAPEMTAGEILQMIHDIIGGA